MHVQHALHDSGHEILHHRHVMYDACNNVMRDIQACAKRHTGKF